MRRKTICSLAAVLALAALYCAQIVYDNEHDPKSPNYKPIVKVIGGTIDGMADSAKYAVGATVTIVAKDSSGYQFENWTSTPPVIFDDSSSDTTTFIMIDKPVTVTANFKDTTCTPGTNCPDDLVYCLLNNACGTTTVRRNACTAVNGTDYPTLSACQANIEQPCDPATHYCDTGDKDINKYCKVGEKCTQIAVGAERCAGLLVDDASGCGASQIKYLVKVTGGTTDSATYAEDDMVTIIATVPPGNQFVKWTSDQPVTFADEKRDTTTFIMIKQAVTVTAHFTTTITPPTKYAVTVTGGGEYEVGKTVAISADVPPGKQFVNWTSTPTVAFINASNAATTFTMIAQAVAITANFEDIPLGNRGITVTNNGGGVANANVQSSPANETIRLIAEPNAGWNFEKWQVVSGGVTLADSTKDTTTFTMPDNAVEVKAVFGLITYTIEYEHNGGTVFTSNPIFYTVAMTPITLNNPTRDGYNFTGWTGSNGATPQIMVAIQAGSTGDREYTANWSLITHTITFDPTGGEVTPDSGITNENKTLDSLPTPTRRGYTFKGWFTDPNVGNEPVTVYDQYSGSRTIFARWEINTYTLTTKINTVGGGVGGSFEDHDGKDSITTTHDYNTFVEVVATTNDSYRFTGWTTAAGDTVGRATSFTITIESDTTLTANFIKTHTLTVSANIEKRGNVTGGGTYDHGASVKVTATANYRYMFTHWTAAGRADTLSKDTVITVKMISDSTLTAHFIIPDSMFEDVRDGQIYRVVIIAGKRWMAENLNYDMADGTGSWCYENSLDSCAKYGRLYDWNTAMAGASSSYENLIGVQGVCPAGWHLPSVTEWVNLMKHIDNSYQEGSAGAGRKLMSTTGWNSNNNAPANGSDTYEFSALPGGIRETDGRFQNVGDHGYWWSASDVVDNVIAYPLQIRNSGSVYFNLYDKKNAMSVRCVQD